jgi:hypothetical protein
MIGHLLCCVTKMRPKTDEHRSVNLKTRTSGCGWLWLAVAGCGWQWLEEENAFTSTQLQSALDARL